MKNLKSITVSVVDPFRKQQIAVHKAAAIAAKCGARVVLLNTFMLPVPAADIAHGDSKKMLTASIRARRERLEQLAAPLRRKGLRIRCEVQWDYPPHEAIVRHVLAAKPDLLIADSHRHSKLIRLVLANTDWELIRHCPCPLWLVRSARLPARSKVMVAVDPSHENAKPAKLDDRLLQVAEVIAQQIGGRIEVAHAYRPPVNVVATSMGNAVLVPASIKESNAHRDRVARSVAALTRKYAVDPKGCHVRAGEPDTTLPALVAARNVDVLVMGAISRSGLNRFFIGSTAERVIDHIDCDVLIVKPAQFRSAVSRRKPQLAAR